MDLASLDLVRDALMLSLILSAPILAVGLVVGLGVSILQAVTQIQDQTLTFVPKIAAMLVVAVVLMGWLAVRLMEFAAAMFGTP
ncbi:MAG: flagellar biosynthesis protein FliQ [Phycisphaerales bacterium]